MAAADDARTAGRRIEQLFGQLDGAEPRARAVAEELVRAVVDLYGSALERIVAIGAEDCPALVERLIADEVVGGLLSVHDLCPDPLAQRLDVALESVRPFLAQHGGDVELLDVDVAAGAVLLALLGSCDGCPSSAVTLRQTVEQAIFEAAPEITIVDLHEPAAPDPALIPVTLGTKHTFESCPGEVVTS